MEGALRPHLPLKPGHGVGFPGTLKGPAVDRQWEAMYSGFAP